ncbi:MAG: hypothetical protein K6C36_01695 [Clostridia bacterium]|nr:hypothetical protein [Clostridia bacterium]
MTTKKALSLLLAILMALSLGVAAFADDGGSWTPIPTSPAGLQDGEYYIDFTDFLTLENDHSDAPVDNATLALQIAVYNGGTWFFDYNAVALKGSITVPAAYTQSGMEETIVFTPEMGAAYILNPMFNVLHEVGASWTKMEKCQWADPLNLEVLGVVNGDKYVDVTGAQAQEIMNDLGNVEFYINPGSRLMEYKMVFDNNAVYWPLMNENLGSYLDYFVIKTYNDGCNWTLMPKSTDGLSDGDYYIDVQGYVDSLVDENGDPLSDDVKQVELQYWGSADYYADLSQMKLKVTLHLPYQDENGNVTIVDQYIPSMYSGSYIPLLLKVYHEPGQSADPDGETQSESPFQSILKSIAAFLLRLVNLIKQIFVK